MKKPKPIASAKPGFEKVRVKRKVFVYYRLQKRELDDDQSFIQLMIQSAKVTLRRVKMIVTKKTDEIVEKTEIREGDDNQLNTWSSEVK